MKKIDLHIHTVPTISDSTFVFSLEVFKRYVQEANLDAVAITNHDLFDLEQFKIIKAALGIVVFPGIEVNLEKGHVLVIDNGSNLDDFHDKTSKVHNLVKKVGDFLTLDQFEAIFGDLNKYLVIPHYEKNPQLSNQTLEKMSNYLFAGEVDSAKKFIRVIKDDKKLTPVLFSDTRIREGVEKFPSRQTYIDCGELSLEAIKLCLKDKTKVSLSLKDGNKVWPIFNNGQLISTGLNILLGERSSGKTHTLNLISEQVESVKYIKQFSLVQQNDTYDESQFKKSIENKRGTILDEYLLELKTVIDEIIKVDLQKNDREVDEYINSLIKSAEEADRQDAYSKTSLFDQDSFSDISETKTLKALIESVRQIIENIEYKEIIDRHLDKDKLKSLACELITAYWDKTLDGSKKAYLNELIKTVKENLKMRTSATQVEEVDLYRVMMDRKKVERFESIVNQLKQPSIIFEEEIQGFRVEARKKPFGGAGEIKIESGIVASFLDAFKVYSSPYKYLRLLLEIENLNRSTIYKLFVNIEYRILNKDGFEVSGGERSEFRLLQEISDAKNYDILLIDEPESSFDNLFLKTDVNKILKGIASFMPVIVVTHNNTVGASVGADYILYAKKDFENNKPVYRIYSGYPTDKLLRSVDDRSIKSYEVILDSLEAGYDAYLNRRDSYEVIKN